MNIFKTIGLFLFIALLSANTTDRKKPVSSLGRVILDFSLKNTDGHMVSLSQNTTAKGYIIVFTCNHCPFAKLYGQRLNDLNNTFTPLGIPLLAINSMDTTMYEEERFSSMQDKSINEKFNFPYLYDATQTIGKMFGAAHTPQVFIIWRQNNAWVVKYSGAIDDNGEHPEQATSFVANAANQLLNNQPITQPETESFGCRIYYRN